MKKRRSGTRRRTHFEQMPIAAIKVVDKRHPPQTKTGPRELPIEPGKALGKRGKA
jgi:hypothetical protein